MSEFLYAIGDVLRHRCIEPRVPKALSVDGTEQTVKWRVWDTFAAKLFVVSRHLEECPGGIQRHYTVRGCESNGRFWAECVKLNEIELTPWSDAATEKQS